jgi:pyruvate dehydrogenase E2 component (dihydrolipoamide acetyltransferase)
MAADTRRPTQVVVPPLGQTVDTVTLVSWYKEEGQAVIQGEMLFAIETDKATLDIEAPASGVLRRVTAAPGDEVRVLSTIAFITAPDADLVETPSIVEAEPVRQKATAATSTGQGASSDQQQRRKERVFISPRARRLAEEQGIQWAAVPPTGPQAAIVERDVRAYLEAQRIHTITPAADRAGAAGAQRAAPLQTGTIPGPGVRTVSADHMSSSAGMMQTERTHDVRRARDVCAPVTLNAEADATALIDVRHRLSQDGVEVSYNDLMLYILGRALREHPWMNASLEGDTIKLWQQIHIGLAVDTDRGLLVPVVHDVDRKGLRQLASETPILTERAQAAQCSPDELSGGTFTLTNLSMFEIDSFTPIINLPECAVLGIGRITVRPAVIDDRIVVRQMMWLSLTFDHRLVDGAPAARFLQRVVHLIEQPYLLLS